MSGSARSRSRIPRPVVPGFTVDEHAWFGGHLILQLIECHGRVSATRPAPSMDAAARRNYRLLNWKLRRALALPYFLRSTTRESRVRKPATFRMPRRSGS